MVAVDSMEHASLVIRSLRSFSHSQKAYHPSDESGKGKVMSTLRQFDRLVMQQAAELDTSRRVNTLISGTPGRPTVASRSSNKEDALSSDDEDDDLEDTACKHAALKKPAKHSTEEDELGLPLAASTARVRHNDGMYPDSDDDLLGGLGSDDDEDMAVLMKDFVGPSLTGERGSSGVGSISCVPGSRSREVSSESPAHTHRTQSAGRVSSAAGTAQASPSPSTMTRPSKSSSSSSVIITPGQRIRVMRPKKKTSNSAK